MQFKRVLITGPTGAIGVALVDLLTKQDTKVIAVCRPNSNNIKNLKPHKNLEIVECDISEFSSLEQKINPGFDVFYHLAWNGTIGDLRNSATVQLDNIKYSIDAVNLAKKLDCEVFIGAGSQAEYGHFNVPADFSVPTKPFSLYGAAKLSCGNLTRVYAQNLGLKHIWTRIFSVYGPCDDKNTLISYFIEKMQHKEHPQITKCNQIWDYLYSYDAAMALLLVASKGQDGEIYSIGSGKQEVLKDFLVQIKDLIDPNSTIKFGAKEYAPNQVMYLAANIENLVKDTGFCPIYSFKEGIKEILENKAGEKYCE